MRDGARRAALHAGGLLAVAGVLAVISGRPFVFPSLGPTAYVLATVNRGEQVAPRRVIGGHLVGVLAGLAAYHTLASGLVVTEATQPMTLAQVRLVVSGVLAVVLTTAGMLSTDTVHPPACATTLIVGLGLLSSPLDGGIILLAVLALYGTHLAGQRLRAAWS